jgi:hypothetical protein
MGLQENRYVASFYDKYKGRVAIGVGYGHNMVEIFPFLFEGDKGEALGIVAMAPLTGDEIESVHIFHLSVFRSNRGNGSIILKTLCLKADELGVTLSLSPIPTANGDAGLIDSRQLTRWYRTFGFRGDSLLCRLPKDLMTA